VSELLTIVVKALAGGALVVVFALISEAVTPKRFAGLFAAAPAVALAGLTITVLTKGAHDARDSSTTMMAGAVAMAMYAAFVVALLRRERSKAASSAAMAVWLAVAAALTVPFVA
jgi:uncharacterized membrane protein (GlpM family)